MKRRSSSTMFRVPNILEIGLTLLAVQKAPQVLNSILFSGNPLTGMTTSLVAAGGVAAAGHFLLKKPLVVDAAIAAGAVEILSPMIDDLIGGVLPVGTLPQGKANEIAIKYPTGVLSEMNYASLNDYTMDVNPMNAAAYRQAY